ncbi:MAG: molybdopterin-dependent oxidoreductase [Dehalococcoidia bacterium]|nr:molybdopterin-dependent oxidoreductase [Dehalococcoidia bacterium]
MLGKTISRRKFLATCGATAAVVTVGGKLFSQSNAHAKALASEAPTLIPTVCGMCDANCGVIAYVTGDTLHKLEGNSNHSHSDGRICPRGSAGVKLLNDPDRLRYPLKRVGQDQFEKISWEQAYEEIGQKLKQIKDVHGPQSLAWVRHPELSDEWDRQFMKAFGSPNIFSHLSVAQSSRHLAVRYTLNGEPVMDYRNSRYILLFGRNHGETIFTANLQSLMAAKENGARIVSVDPRLTNTAARAHEWLAIRPGTDNALLLSMMNVIIREKLFDADYVANYTEGFDDLKAMVAEKTPAWAARITDIPAETITRIAREFAGARPACGVDPGHHGPFGDVYSNSFQTARSALILNALVGSYGAKGGTIMSPRAKLGKFNFPATPPIKVARADGVGEGNFALVDPNHGLVQLLPDIILNEKPYPIRGLIVNRFNPARSLPDSKRTAEALSRLDLLVVIDTMPSDTAAFAHYVLPESTYLERLDPLAISTRLRPEIAIRQPVVKPLHDTKPSTEIITGLARAAGLGSFFTFTVEDVIKANILPLGLTLEQLGQKGVIRNNDTEVYGTPKFDTPSGKIDIYAERLKQVWLDPMPNYQAPLVEPKAGSFRLLQGRVSLHTNSATQNNPWLNRLKPDNELWINTVQAARLGISNKQKVRVRSEVGEVEVNAKVTEAIHPSAVFLAYGFGHGAKMQRLSFGKGANSNSLTVGRTTSGSGGSAVSETLVTVEAMT